jgi:hypothetical protein
MMLMKRSLMLTLCWFLFSVDSAAANGYRETFDPQDGTPDSALHGTMPVGEDGEWSAHMEGGFYLLENRGSPTDVRYFYVLPTSSTWNSHGDIVRVSVGGMFVGGDYHSGAGLLLGFDPATRYYDAFVLQDNLEYAIYRRDADGLRAVLSGTSSAIRRAGRNLIEVRFMGDSMHMFINQTEVGSLAKKSGHGEGIGLIALGAGLFEFDDFELPNAVLDGQTGPAQTRRDDTNSVSPRTRYAGRFEGQQISVEFRESGETVSGVLQLGSETCQLSGRYMQNASGAPATYAQALRGQALCGPDRFQFEASLENNNRLIFDLEGIDYRLNRVTPDNASAASSTSPVVQQAPASPTRVPQHRTTAPPQDYRAMPHGATSGNLWLARLASQGRDASSLIRNALDQFSGYFGHRPNLQNAIGDRQGTELQVLFNTRVDNLDVQGLAMVMISGTDATIAVAYDEPQRLRHSLPIMLNEVGTTLPAPPPVARPVPNLQQTPFPDGSGSIGLPPGWRIIGATKGMVDVMAPDRSMLALGIHGPAMTPQAVAQAQQITGLQTISAGSPVIPFTDPSSAFPMYWEQMPGLVSQATRRQMPAQRITRIIESSPRPWPGGQAAMIDVEWVLEEANPIHFRSIALFGMQPGYAGNWTFYCSSVSAPVDLFARNVPTLLAIWQSWRVAARVHEERIQQALNDMREVNQIINQVGEQTRASFDAIHADWTENILGTTNVADAEVGELYEVPLYDVEQIVENLNEAAGYPRYEHIPLRDLQ